MIFVYGKVPAKEIRKEAKESVTLIEDWFEANPKRKVCNTKVWYGKMVKIHKGKVAEEINRFAEEAIEGDKR